MKIGNPKAEIGNLSYGVVVHGGAGSSKRLNDTCRKVCEAAFGMLRAGTSAIDAATEAVRLMEDDGRFNAGSGSVVRLDGKTVEMDASVMDSRGRLGIVMNVRDVKNPVLVAMAVTETPHVALAGQGAALFARLRGFAPLERISPRSLLRHKKTERLVKEGKLHKKDTRWKGVDVRELWNFETPYEEHFPSDTVGAVALDLKGDVAVASSTGGATPMMLGRVGDTPMVGSGFYAGPAGAVGATGIGEEIIRHMLARTVYDMIRTGEDVKEACEKGVLLFPPAIPVGVIAISRDGFAIKANRDMAAYTVVEGC